MCESIDGCQEDYSKLFYEFVQHVNAVLLIPINLFFFKVNSPLVYNQFSKKKETCVQLAVNISANIYPAF